MEPHFEALDEGIFVKLLDPFLKFMKAFVAISSFPKRSLIMEILLF